MKELTLKKRDIRAATFCSGFSWAALFIGVAGFVVFKEYRAICAGVLVAAGIVMFRGMKILRDKCACPGCGAGAMGNARDREYIGLLSAKKDFVICPVCKKKIRLVIGE